MFLSSKKYFKDDVLARTYNTHLLHPTSYKTDYISVIFFFNSELLKNVIAHLLFSFAIIIQKHVTKCNQQ